ncbi:MAG: MmoB/DmpM family protein [Gammaproteobacteria bacterium]
MTENVFLALQANDDARPIVEAIEKDNPDVDVSYQPAMIRMTAPGKLTVLRETVSELIGRDWDPQELHLVLISFGGNVEEDEDQFTISWAS